MKIKKVTVMNGIFGFLLFAIGMCMCLVPQWNAFYFGIFLIVIGMLLMFLTWFLWGKLTNRPKFKISKEVFISTLLKTLSLLILGLSLSLVLVWEQIFAGILLGIPALMVFISSVIKFNDFEGK